MEQQKRDTKPAETDKAKVRDTKMPPPRIIYQPLADAGLGDDPVPYNIGTRRGW